MDLAEMERFKARAIEIVRKSKDPARSLQLMRIKASSFLDSDVSSGRGACSSREISLPPQGVRLAAPEAGPPGWCQSDAKVAEVQVDLGPNHGAVRIGSEVQCPVQLCANDGLGIQQFKICKTKQLFWKFAGQFRDMKISHIRFVHGVLVQEEPDPGGFCLFVKLLAEQKEIADHVPNKLAPVLNAISLRIRRWLCLLVGAVYWETKNASKEEGKTEAEMNGAIVLHHETCWEKKSTGHAEDYGKVKARKDEVTEEPVMVIKDETDKPVVSCVHTMDTNLEEKHNLYIFVDVFACDVEGISFEEPALSKLPFHGLLQAFPRLQMNRGMSATIDEPPDPGGVRCWRTVNTKENQGHVLKKGKMDADQEESENSTVVKAGLSGQLRRTK